MSDEKVSKLSSKELGKYVIEYVNEWMKEGAGPQDHEITQKLTLPMPAPCTETVCVRGTDDGPELLVTVREDDDAWEGMLHSIGSAHMLLNYINKDAPQEILDFFPEELINRVKEELPSWWNLSTEHSVMLRIFQRELGLPEEDCLNLINEVQFVGPYHNLTIRGGESVFIYLVDVTDYQDKFTKEVSWIPTNELTKREDFIDHQVGRVQYAMTAWPIL